MPTDQPGATYKFVLPGVETSELSSRVKDPISRKAGPGDKLLDDLIVKQHFDLSPAGRSAAGSQRVVLDAKADDILALEMSDGFILYTSAQRLAEDLRAVAPSGSNGDQDAVRIDVLRSRGPASRGLGDWIIHGLSLVGFDGEDIEKKIIAAAKAKIKEWLGDKARDFLEKGASWALTKALMWAIENQIESQPGLYRWVDRNGDPGNLKKVQSVEFDAWHSDQPILVFIHGTASSTLGSFGELTEARAASEWNQLVAKYGRFIYTFEHLTFSESPLENALALARSLPEKARLSLVTHSRGGLVGDLLCMADLGNGLIENFARNDDALKEMDQLDRERLLELRVELARKAFRIERYVRVASPSRGTLLAGCHLDAFLSALLHLVGLVPYLQAGPVYKAVKRIILQIVKNRTDPRLVPGIEAMLPDSPLVSLIGQAQPAKNAAIGVIAGDCKGSGILKRIGVFLTDYIFFEEEDNDLVVDTNSMFGGIARDQGYYLFDQGTDVNHFRYFANARTRKALQSWLTEQKVSDAPDFRTIVAPVAPIDSISMRSAKDNAGPQLVFLPGIMGSHLRVGEKERVWLNFFRILRGGIEKIRINQLDVHPDGILQWFYSDLVTYFQKSHRVHIFSYDWRLSLVDSARRLADLVDGIMNTTDQPVRIMAHSMGGLVVRMMMARHGKVWDRMAARDGFRLIMLGTPNHGSHLMVETMVGMSGDIRKLALLDHKRKLQILLDQIAEYPGALQLLPQPEFKDAGNSFHDYYTLKAWEIFKENHNDVWFGKSLGAKPASDLLERTKKNWQTLGDQFTATDQIAYVAGYGQRTPCGIKVDEKQKRLRMIGTLNGDGSVTHKSGLLDELVRHNRVWYMDTDHTGLTSTKKAFPALLELLENGETDRLPTTKPSVRGAEETFLYDVGPVHYPTEEDFARTLLGGRRTMRSYSRAAHTLSVSCHAMDLRYATHPILVGHYEGDPIAGAESQIDRNLVNGGLSDRYHLGMYAGPPGTTTIVLPQANQELAHAGIRRGAIVIGLGKYGDLTADRLVEAVRNGVLRYLLHLMDTKSATAENDKGNHEIGLSALLLGYNSTTNISVTDSVHAIVCGVMEANRQFEDVMEGNWRVTHLVFTELFLDVAISAARVISQITTSLAGQAAGLACHLIPSAPLVCDKGAKQRLGVLPGASYWPRLSITATEQKKDGYQTGCHPVPPGLQNPIGQPEGPDRLEGIAESLTESSSHPNRRLELAHKLRFTYLSQRARAETELLQHQPDLVESLVQSSIQDWHYKPELSNTLFQLIFPHDFKASIRQTDRLVLVVDDYTANYPWEMLAVDDEPLVTKTAVVRQFVTLEYRSDVRHTLKKNAYVIGNPSTKGFYNAFLQPGAPVKDSLDPLPGAKRESQTIQKKLLSQGYEVEMAESGSQGDRVINTLFRKPYRIIHISAHGVFKAGSQNNGLTGVVLSDGLFLTAAEIGQLEVVPHLVFLNCCFLGKINATPSAAFNRLAYSLARELIEIGVRAVVAAGWAVRDDAGEFFAETFYHALLHQGETFGNAIHSARLKTYTNPRFKNCNTWGAYQAYGDPDFRIDPVTRHSISNVLQEPIVVDELIAAIDELSTQISFTDGNHWQLAQQLNRILSKAPRQWRQRSDVLYACGRFHGEIKDFDKAIECFKQALAIDDRRGRVPVRAIEQLANFEARKGEHCKDMQLIHNAINRLQALLQAAGGNGLHGSEDDPVNSERCALLGSAYKRLAGILKPWSAGSENKALPEGIKEALKLSIQWYQKGEGEYGSPEFEFYNAQNRLALKAILEISKDSKELRESKKNDAKQARHIGNLAHRRYPETHEVWDLIMAGDSELIAAIIDDGLMEPSQEHEPCVSVTKIIERYKRLMQELPKSKREYDSVVTQIRLLKRFVEKQKESIEKEKSTEENRVQTLKNLADNLGRIAKALDPSVS